MNLLNTLACYVLNETFNEKKRGQCVDSDSLGPQFSPISLAFYFCLQKILFCLRLARAFSDLEDWHRSRSFLTVVAFHHPQDEFPFLLSRYCFYALDAHVKYPRLLKNRKLLCSQKILSNTFSLI